MRKTRKRRGEGEVVDMLKHFIFFKKKPEISLCIVRIYSLLQVWKIDDAVPNILHNGLFLFDISNS